MNQRTKEIGIRIALGATSALVWRTVGVQVTRSVVLGVLIGAIGARVAGRVLESLLWGVSVTDLTTFLIVPLLMFMIAVMSGFLPGWRATRVQPALVLRDD